jgi:hypothetical protein
MGLKKDKAKHMLGSFIGVLILSSIGMGMALGAIMIFLVGLSKEIWDYAGHGVASWEDLGANVIGIILAVTFIWYLEQKRKEAKRSAKKSVDAPSAEQTWEKE